MANWESQGGPVGLQKAPGESQKVNLNSRIQEVIEMFSVDLIIYGNRYLGGRYVSWNGFPVDMEGPLYEGWTLLLQ